MNYHRQIHDQARLAFYAGVASADGNGTQSTAWNPATAWHAQWPVPKKWQQTARDSALRFVTVVAIEPQR